MIDDLIAIQTPQGVTYVTHSDYVRSLGCANNLGAIDPAQATTAIATTGASLAASLVAAGVASQAIPVVGQILGGIALISGFIAGARAKAKAAKEQGAQIDAATVDLLQQNSQLDTMLRQAQQQVSDIKSEMNRLGLNGAALDGFGDWLKKTFTPGAYQQSIVADKTENYNQLLSQVESKIGILQQFETELKNLYSKLTGGKNLQTALVIGGSVAVGLGVLYFLNEKYKWIKF